MAYTERRKNDYRARWQRPDGTYDSKGGFLTEDDALDYGRGQETDVRRGTYYDRRDGDITLAEWAAMWLAANNVRPTSVRNYRKRLRCQILPVWGELTLAHIAESPLKVRKWEKDLRASGLSVNYVAGILLVFRMLLDDAVTEELIKKSPASAPSRRRGRYERPVEAEKVFGTPEQLLELAENARILWGLTGYAFTLTMAYTGMRLGEMYGLRREYCHPLWPASEPDPDPHVRRAANKRYGSMPAVRVQWQYMYEYAEDGSKGVQVLAEPKYESRRTLVIPRFLADLLCEVLDSHDSEWVFPALKGGNLLSSDFNSYYWHPTVDGSPARSGRYKRAALEAVEGLEGLMPSGVRHGHKVMLDEDPFHVRVAVEGRMGHVMDSVEDVYSHVTPGMEKHIAEYLQERWEHSLAAREGQHLPSPGNLLIDQRLTGASPQRAGQRRTG